MDVHFLPPATFNADDGIVPTPPRICWVSVSNPQTTTYKVFLSGFIVIQLKKKYIFKLNH